MDGFYRKYRKFIMNLECINKARELIKAFLDQKESRFIPPVDFVKKLLKMKKGELELLGCELSQEDIMHLSKEINSEETVSIPLASTIMAKKMNLGFIH